MLVLRLRDVRVLAALAILAVVSLGLVLFQPTVVEEYDLEELVLLPWGEETGHVGRKVGLDGQSHGPRSFAVDEQGNLYLADTFNHRVVKLGVDGTWVDDFAVESEGLIQDIGLDGHNNIYVVDYGGSGVFQYSQGGELLQSWAINAESTTADSQKTELWVTDRLHVHRPGEVVIARTRLSAEEYRRDLARIDLNKERTWSLASTTITEADGDDVGELKQPGNFYTFTVTNDGMLVTEWAENPFERTVVAWNKADEVEWQATVRSKQFIDEAALVGTDDRGRAYLGVNLNLPNGNIYRLGPNGVDYRLDIAGEPGAVAHVYARATDNGDIYILRPAPRGVRISKYAYTRQLVLLPRWD